MTLDCPIAQSTHKVDRIWVAGFKVKILKVAFNTYVNKILTSFDHLPTLEYLIDVGYGIIVLGGYFLEN